MCSSDLSIRESSGGKANVDEVATAIREIAEQAVTVKTLVEEVSARSQEQATAIAQVSQAIIRMQQSGQNTAATAQETAAAAAELTQQSVTLTEIGTQLSALVEGGLLTPVSRQRGNSKEGRF